MASTLTMQCMDITKHMTAKGFGFKLPLRIAAMGFDFTMVRVQARQSTVSAPLKQVVQVVVETRRVCTDTSKYFQILL